MDRDDCAPGPLDLHAGGDPIGELVGEVLLACEQSEDPWEVADLVERRIAGPR